MAEVLREGIETLVYDEQDDDEALRKGDFTVYMAVRDDGGPKPIPHGGVYRGYVWPAGPRNVEGFDYHPSYYTTVLDARSPKQGDRSEFIDNKLYTTIRFSIGDEEGVVGEMQVNGTVGTHYTIPQTMDVKWVIVDLASGGTESDFVNVSGAPVTIGDDDGDD